MEVKMGGMLLGLYSNEVPKHNEFVIQQVSASSR